MTEFLIGLLCFDFLIMAGLAWRCCTLADERDKYHAMAEHFEIESVRVRFDLLELQCEEYFDED